jgi:hypothetical protein
VERVEQVTALQEEEEGGAAGAVVEVEVGVEVAGGEKSAW